MGVRFPIGARALVAYRYCVSAGLVPLYIQVIEGCYDALAGMRARSRPMSELVLGILTMVRSIPRHETLRPEMRTTNPACDAGDDLLPAGKTMHTIAQSPKSEPIYLTLLSYLFS